MATRQTDIHHIGSAGEEVTERDVGNADVNPALAVADAGHDGHQDYQILQDDENTDEEEDGHGCTDVVLGV